MVIMNKKIMPKLLPLNIALYMGYEKILIKIVSIKICSLSVYNYKMYIFCQKIGNKFSILAVIYMLINVIIL